MPTISKGSITRAENKPNARCRKWRLSVSVDKKRVQKRFTGLYSEAKAELERWKNELAKATCAQNSALIVDYFDSWINSRESAGSIAPTTAEKCRNYAKAFCHNLPGITLDELTPAMVDASTAKLRDGKSPSGRKLSGTYLATVLSTASAMYDDAVRNGLAHSNPITDAQRPKLDTAPKKALTNADALKFLQSLDPAAPTQLALILCLTQGLRRSEAVNLRWCDIHDGLMEIQKSKTNAGIRVLPISVPCRAALDSAPHNGEYICTKSDGTRVKPHSVTRWMSRHTDFTCHELRHTYLTMLARGGATPAAMQHLAGHVSPVTTLKIYTHVQDEECFNAVDAINSALA